MLPHLLKVEKQARGDSAGLATATQQAIDILTRQVHGLSEQIASFRMGSSHEDYREQIAALGSSIPGDRAILMLSKQLAALGASTQLGLNSLQRSAPLFVQNKELTVDATPIDLLRVPFKDPQGCIIRAEVVARFDDNSAVNTYTFEASYRRNGATIVEVGGPAASVDKEEDAALACTFGIDSTDFRIQATGKAATNIYWLGRVTVVSL